MAGTRPQPHAPRHRLFVLRPPPGRAAERDGEIVGTGVAGVLDENAASLERLVAKGWTEVWSGARMFRGEPLDWMRTGIWSPFNHAIG